MAGFTTANHFGSRFSSELTRAAAKQNRSRLALHALPSCFSRTRFNPSHAGVLFAGVGRLDTCGPFFAFPDRPDNIEHCG
jgi:hypothetical protein